MANGTRSGAMLISIGSAPRHKVSCPLQPALLELIEKLIRKAIRALHEASVYCSQLVLNVEKLIPMIKSYSVQLTRC